MKSSWARRPWTDEAWACLRCWLLGLLRVRRRARQKVTRERPVAGILPMRALARILLGFFGVIVLVIAAGLFWIFFYSGDLPDVNALAQ